MSINQKPPRFYIKKYASFHGAFYIVNFYFFGLSCFIYFLPRHRNLTIEIFNINKWEPNEGPPPIVFEYNK